MMSKDETYSGQRRGDRGAYERYLQGMDASMRQKVALTAAHLLSQGKIADMGMGSGTGSEALAALYPALQVVGVDIEPTMVQLAQDRYAHANLSFEVGDIAKPVFAEGSLDGILNSSVLHHVTSFNGYGSDRASDALRVQVKQLSERGILIVRDFVAPALGNVLLDLPDDDGGSDAEGAAESSAALFERFAKTYRPLSDEPGFPYSEVQAEDLRAGWKRYRLAAQHAVEFVLRKDYRRDWDSELLEAYTYFTQEQFEEVYAALGLRVLASTPIWNPWIVHNRFQDKFAWRDEAGALLEFPATNYIIVGEKVREGEGVRFREGQSQPPIGFLELESYVDMRSDQVMDLVRRPNRSVDIIPWFENDGDLFMLARASYPRPIGSAASHASVSLDGRHSAGYVIEPLVVVQTDKPLGTTVEESLAKDAGIGSAEILSFQRGTSYYPSPGGIQEEVRSAFVQVTPGFAQRPLDNRSGYTSSGRVLAIDAQQILRASQVGGLPDARIELNAYDLLISKSKTCGPWIGETIELSQCETPVAVSTARELLARPSRRVFAKVARESSRGFLEIRCADFHEHDNKNLRCSTTLLEFVVPRPLSLNTIATALLARDGDQILLGIDDDDLPAAQGFTGNSDLYVTPAWRLPRKLTSFTPARAWIRERLRAEYGIEVGNAFHLGGPYHPSLGLTPEVVHPIAFEVASIGDAPRSLRWFTLTDAVAHRDAFQDGHLRTVLLRSAHALSLL